MADSTPAPGIDFPFTVWKVANMERELSDGVVFTVHYTVTRFKDGEQAGAYGSLGFEAPEPDNLIPYADLTEETVVGWVTSINLAKKKWPKSKRHLTHRLKKSWRQPKLAGCRGSKVSHRPGTYRAQIGQAKAHAPRSRSAQPPTGKPQTSSWPRPVKLQQTFYSCDRNCRRSYRSLHRCRWCVGIRLQSPYSESRDAVIRLTMAVESIAGKLEELHQDMKSDRKEIYSKLSRHDHRLTILENRDS
jgi:hypothetical protein